MLEYAVTMLIKIPSRFNGLTGRLKPSYEKDVKTPLNPFLDPDHAVNDVAMHRMGRGKTAEAALFGRNRQGPSTSSRDFL